MHEPVRVRPDMHDEDDLIPISSLQHAHYCERQCALIHIEQMWEENQYTAEGRVLHERVDVAHRESRGSNRTEYGMAIRSIRYGLIGKADVVEIERGENGEYARVQPVEFKRGKRKESDVDRVQLCAQAICLEEMFSTNISEGQFYYQQERRRSTVQFDDDLRSTTLGVIQRVQELLSQRKTPPAEYIRAKCDQCSLFDRCMPRAVAGGGKSVLVYVVDQIRRSGEGS